MPLRAPGGAGGVDGAGVVVCRDEDPGIDEPTPGAALPGAVVAFGGLVAGAFDAGLPVEVDRSVDLGVALGEERAPKPNSVVAWPPPVTECPTARSETVKITATRAKATRPVISAGRHQGRRGRR